MVSCYIDRLPDDLLCIIFELACEEDQATLSETLQNNWDDSGDKEYYERGDAFPNDLSPPLAPTAAAGVCERWKSIFSQISSMWTVLQISCREGAASLERARTFLQHSGTHPLKITILWDNPSWIVSVLWNGTMPHKDQIKPTSRDEITAGVRLMLIIQELYAHVHRWREFTLRTTSVAHTYQALSLISRPSVHPARMLEKLHLQLVHNERHAVHYVDEPSLFPGSASPIRDLVLFGISWAWPSSSILSSHLINLRFHYNAIMNEDWNDSSKQLEQLLGALPNLQTLVLEPELDTFDIDITSIKLPNLHCLTIQSYSMGSWAVDFLQNVYMPNLRVLTLCGVTPDGNVGGILDELARLTDSHAMESEEERSSCLLELDELHLLHFPYRGDLWPIHRLYTQMASVKVLTLGPAAKDDNVAMAMGLLPSPFGRPDLPLPALQTLIVFDVPRRVMRNIVLERTPLAGPLEELYYQEEKDRSVPDDWKRQVERYHRIDCLKSRRYCDIVGRQWSYAA